MQWPEQIISYAYKIETFSAFHATSEKPGLFDWMALVLLRFLDGGCRTSLVIGFKVGGFRMSL